jgi:hypothetical protein
MTYYEAHISNLEVEFFKKNLYALSNYEVINSLTKEVSGINNFFSNQKESSELLEHIKEYNSIVSDPDRREYGDFQTNKDLSSLVSNYISLKRNDFEFLLEPTCGKGNFILASLELFKTLKKIVGVEIYKPYVWETKFKILKYYLTNRTESKPDIDIIHGNAFEYSYKDLAKKTKHLKTLVIGNPPWVTNSELGTINSKNLPNKSNFKKHNGIEAITGKGNFDIGENISLIMLRNFQNHEGMFAFLIKNSIIKNIIYDQKGNKFNFNKSEKLNIDSKKEFNVSVNASLFLTNFNNSPDYICQELDFYNKNHLTTFGWYNNKFVYSVNDYDKSNSIDGKSKFIWRSGVKHDCSKVMELTQENGHYINSFGEQIKLESNLVYGLLKSSDLRGDKTNTYRKSTIITQDKIGQETNYIKDKFPLTFKYLKSHKELFDKRKSSIYKNKPDFSIFGIGDYSFASYKVAISGLYKSTHFTLVYPDDLKPIMLDDTCYFIGFKQLKMAQIAHYLVNSDIVQKFLKSITFSDSKRPINKDILMRIDFEKVFEYSDFLKAKENISDLKIEDWEKFGESLKEPKSKQMTLF